MPVPKMTKVESSRLSAVGYDEDKMELFIEFPTGKLYKYYGVEPDVHEAFMESDSKGIFFGTNIKGKDPKNPIYRYDEVSAEEKAEKAGKPTLVKKAPEGKTIAPGGGKEADTIAELPEKDEELKDRALASLEKAKSLGTIDERGVFIIENGDVYQAVVNRIRVIAAERKLVSERAARLYDPAYKTYLEARTLRDEALAPYDTADKMLNDAVKAYLKREEQKKRDDEERERKELEAASKAEAEEKSRQETEKAAQHAEAVGDTREADSIRANPIAVAPKAVAPVIHRSSVPEVKGVHKMKENWQYRILDEAGIPITLDYYTLDPKKLLARAKDRKSLGTIPGVLEFYDEGSLTIKK